MEWLYDDVADFSDKSGVFVKGGFVLIIIIYNYY